MPGWTAKQLQLKGHNFKTTVIRFEGKREGLCYHGDTIWKQETGWEDFIDLDWQKVWEKGQLCDYKDLPEDMKIECPGCGHARKKGSIECPKCGIIYNRYKSIVADNPLPKKAQREKPEIKKKSNTLGYTAAGIVLLLAVFAGFGYYGKNEPEKEADSTTVEEPGEAAAKRDAVQHPVNTYNNPEPSGNNTATDYGIQEPIGQEAMPDSAPGGNNTATDYGIQEPVRQEVIPDSAIGSAKNTEEKFDFGDIKTNYKTIMRGLDNQYNAIIAEQKQLVEEKKQAKTSEEKIKVNEKIIRLNDKISAYERRRAAFDAEVEAYNKGLEKH